MENASNELNISSEDFVSIQLRLRTEKLDLDLKKHPSAEDSTHNKIIETAQTAMSLQPASPTQEVPIQQKPGIKSGQTSHSKCDIRSQCIDAFAYAHSWKLTDFAQIQL